MGGALVAPAARTRASPRSCALQAIPPLLLAQVKMLFSTSSYSSCRCDCSGWRARERSRSGGAPARARPAPLITACSSLQPAEQQAAEQGPTAQAMNRRSAALRVPLALAAAAVGALRPGTWLHPPAARAGTAGVQKAYDSYAPTYDVLDGGQAATALGFDALRERLVAQARGDVVEVAVGTGLNLPLYRWGPSGVRSLQALDLSEGMLAQARGRRTASPELSSRPITFQQADATQLPLASSSADCVLDTFSLCVIQDPLAALREMARVVRGAEQGGRVLLLEHAKSDNPLLGAYQDLTAGAVAATAKGCAWNQPVPELLRQAGLRPTRVERHVAGTIVLVEAVKA